ncbi:diaminopropionate ammonia-lyase [Acetobacterium tundrae]|uniref:Diaminopropionate ammonia-lyase n=1 Tax=Acetobacterium tundrae TaxID=132932 RepID=A0ABR6WGM9_9FIRM|nr:diaminopropionate ammonia-lyase [Acetobacterium tundrae]MBC3795632.1 diaminopropionate ammonia-lyase [Acetobacterium tundrae]
MKDGFYITDIPKAKESSDVKAFLSVDHGKNVIDYHRSFPAYQETPLADLKELAKKLGLAGMYVKDESYRFGLNAFKVLGGSYSIGQWMAQKLGIKENELTYEKLTDPETKKKLGDLTFVTATDGNHGRGVAWTARELGQKSVVYMPKGSAEERLNNIRAEGAEASITDMNYDEAVRLANKMGDEKGWIMVQDTAWEGYEEIPRWIMQGYATMAFEATEQLGDDVPTHVFLQAGVGSLAGAVSGLLTNYYGDQKPIITIVEPNKADCIYKTAEAKDNKLHFVTGDMDTIMAGLACGEPNQIGWDVITECDEYAVSCPDWVAAEGMRVLGNTVGTDPKVISGESGAVTAGLVATVMTRPDLKWLKDELKLDKNSKVLCFSTEGDTDRQNYRRIVWDGYCSSDAQATGTYEK